MANSLYCIFYRREKLESTIGNQLSTSKCHLLRSISINCTYNQEETTWPLLPSPNKLDNWTATRPAGTKSATLSIRLVAVWFKITTLVAKRVVQMIFEEKWIETSVVASFDPHLYFLPHLWVTRHNHKFNIHQILHQWWPNNPNHLLTRQRF